MLIEQRNYEHGRRKNMVKIRQDAWMSENDEMLAEMVLRTFEKAHSTKRI